VSSENQHEPVVIRDKRRLDPVTGEPRHAVPAAETAEADAAAEANVPKAEALLLEERTRDLQRVQAEYANYRKRVERDRVALAEAAVGGALIGLLPVLDDIDRARAHGDLTGAFKAVADQLETVLGKLGLTAFGEPGDPFDPAIHEAVMHEESPNVTEPTATTVWRRERSGEGRADRDVSGRRRSRERDTDRSRFRRRVITTHLESRSTHREGVTSGCERASIAGE
jgi:molecular chaperone GrpE